MPTLTYREFLASKAQLADASGFEPIDLTDFLFGFQGALTVGEEQTDLLSGLRDEEEGYKEVLSDTHP